MCYETGSGVEKDETKGSTHFLEGALKGDLLCIRKSIDYLMKEA
jgi:hypothetical protein